MLGTLGIQDFALILAHGASPFASGCDDTTICSIRILLGRRAWILVGVSRNGWFGGTPISGTPLVGSGHHCFCNWVFFCCFNFTLFSMCVHQIPISVRPQFFSSIRTHSMPILMVWSSPLYCLNPPMFAIILWSNRSNPPVFASARSPVNVVCRAQPSDRTKGGREMPEGWRRGGTCWFHHETWRFHMVETVVLVSLSHSFPFYGRKTPPKLNKLPQNRSKC